MSPSKPLRIPPLVLALAGLPLAAFGQALPGSGQLLQQAQPRAPQQQQAEPSLQIQSAATPAGTDATPFAVSRIDIEGNTRIPTATLHALVADGEGGTLTLTRLNVLAQRITDYYRAHGYPLARAFIPAQTLDSGTVRIRVVEARYDQVRLDNRSRASDRLLHATLAPLRPGEVVESAALDRRLLLAGELPGAAPRATLSPGDATGTSTLDVAVAATPSVEGHVSVDDMGTRYTGRMRVGAGLGINEPLRQGDRVDLDLLTAGHGMRYARAGYQLTLNGQGTRAGAAWSALDYALGGPLRALDASGRARVGSAWLSQPLVRSRSARLDARLQFDHKQLRDAIGSADVHRDRHTDSATLNLIGTRADQWAGGGSSTASVGITHGRLHFDDATAQAADAASARTEGSYTRWNLGLSRLQNLSATTRLFANLSAQGASGNLDSSEQFLLGGSDSVRGYDMASLGGDRGWLGTLELRHDLDWDCVGRCTGSVFIDHGALHINSRPWTAGSNHAQLSSIGVGLAWFGRNQWQGQVQLAKPFGAESSLAASQTDARLWVWLLKGF